MGQTEVLTVEEFADRMKISRTTVFDWISKGKLKAGRHYIHIGRVIRFEWGQDLLRRLHEDSLQVAEEVHDNPKPRREAKKPRVTNKKSTALNWDC